MLYLSTLDKFLSIKFTKYAVKTFIKKQVVPPGDRVSKKKELSTLFVYQFQFHASPKRLADPETRNSWKQTKGKDRQMGIKTLYPH